MSQPRDSVTGHVNRCSAAGRMPSLDEARADLTRVPMPLRAAAARALVADGLIDPWCALSLAAFGLWTVDAEESLDVGKNAA